MVGHREFLRLFSFTHPFWACLGGLQLYMPRGCYTCRIVLRVTQVAMRGNSCIHPIDLISNTLLLVVKNGVEIVGTPIK